MVFSLSIISLGSDYDLANATSQSDIFAYGSLPQEQLDLLAGSPGVEKISLLGGNDQVTDNDDTRFYLGVGGNDLIFGNGGSDTLDGGAGNDSLDGGNGNDWLLGSAGNDSILGQEGNDYINAGLDNDTLLGGFGEDTLNGLNGDDIIWGEEGNDRAIGQIGNDTIFGGFGLDTISGTDGNDYLSGEEDNDRLLGEVGNDTLSGGTGQDNLWGGNDHDELFGNEDNDRLLGELGNDTLSGGTGLDSLSGGDGNDQLSGDEDNDRLLGEVGNDTLSGGAGQDNLWGGNDHDELFGNEDNDRLLGELGNDTLSGGTGLDSLFGNDGDDHLSGDEDADQLFGNAGNDNLFGGIGEDTLLGGGHNDYLAGDADNDRLLGDTGNDTVLGGTGQDSLFGGNGNDQLSGDEDNDHLLGDAGNDTVLGGTGQDSLFGGDGNDQLSGDEDHDQLLGDAGNDTVLGGTGQDSLLGGDGNDQLSGDEDHDQLLGELGDDTLSGGIGQDSLLGGDGNDQLSGDEDHDQLLGELGDDTILGGDGNDTLSGGAGVNILTGGDGNDVFLMAVGEGQDTITDFQIGVDKLQLPEGVLFSQLKFQVTGDDTLITLSQTGQAIARLQNTRPFDINRSDFIQITPDPATLGTNLSGIKDWSTQLPFLDHFKLSRSWITQANPGDPGYNGQWGTNEYNLLDLDENGWVKSLPAPEDAPIYTKVSTFVLTADTPNSLPTGKFVVLYDGEGTLEYSYDGKKVVEESTPGRDVINVATTTGSGVLLTLTATDPNQTGNYLRNIRVIHADQEDLYNSGEIFNPLFLQKTDDFAGLRFMDWLETNGSAQKEWIDRPEVNDASYAEHGVPLEVMIDLANELDADPWFNMPHQATDEYIANFAQIVKEQLEPDLKAYVEFSNEMWNWSFSQTKYASDQAKARWGIGGNGYMQWYGMRSAQTSDIWENVFGDEKHRLVNIISTQTAWTGLENAVLDSPKWVAEGNEPPYKHGIDAYAITGYFGRELGLAENTATVKSWLTEPDGGFSKAFEQLRYGNLLQNSKSLVEVENLFNYHANVAKTRGLQLIGYEGGQHIVGVGNVANDATLTNFFIALNRRPEMYDIYTELLNSWEEAGGTLFTHFTDIGEPRKWGSWGSLEYLGQDGSPKYDALIDFIETHPDPTR